HFDHTFDRCHPGIQSPYLQLLGGIWYSRRSNSAGYDKIRQQRLPWLSIRVFSQHKAGRQQFLRCYERTVQSQPVWRGARRSDPERQNILLRVLTGEETAAWGALCRLDSDVGHEDWRFHL